MVDGVRTIKKVLVGIPKIGDTDPEAYDNRLEMMTHLGGLQVLSSLGLKQYDGFKFNYPDGIEYQFSISTVGDVFIAYAREQMATIAMDNGFDYLFMIDDDMLGPADLFERLVIHDVDIVAPLAFTRISPHKPVIYNIAEGYDKVTQTHYYTNYAVERYPKNQLVQCDAVGFGAVLIKVDVMKKLKKKDQPLMMSTCGSGEDIFFCHKAIRAGFRVFSDTATQLAHLGPRKKITEYTYENQNGENIIKERQERGDTDKYNMAFGKVKFADRPRVEVCDEN